ncbi:hypothetical protein JW916_16450 [Candidatus Sumerlaeota bacterium]|nr:hypothetical protein [Candidatus Sumerlaeota bacterium]
MSERLALLQAWLMPSPGLKREMLGRILLASDDPDVRWRARLYLNRMPDRQIRRLRREDRYNRFAGVANYFTDLSADILTGNVQRVLRLLLDGLFVSEPLNRLTPRNRQVLAIYDQWLNAHPPPPSSDVDALRPYVEGIRRRRDDEREQELLARGRWHLRNNRPEEARQAFSLCAESDPRNRTARKGLLEAGRASSANMRMRLGANRALPETLAHASLRDERRGLLVAMCQRDAQGAALWARRLRETDPAAPIACEAAYAEIVALESVAPDPLAATEARRFLSASARKDSSAAQRQKAFDRSPDANAAAALARSRSRHRADVWQYVLLGDRSVPTDLRTPGLRARVHRFIDSVSVLLPFEWIVRGFRCRYGQPLDDVARRDAAASYVMEARAMDRPLSAEERQVALDLAESCVRCGYFNQARAWHSLAAGEDPLFESRLDRKAGRRMLAAARAQAEPASQNEILRDLVARFPDTRSAGKARRLLAKMDERGPKGLGISKTELAQWPSLWLGRALRLDPSWFDGEKANGELAAEGVVIDRRLGPESVEIDLIFPGQKVKKRATPTDQMSREIAKELVAWERESAARRRAAAILDRPAFLLDIEGSAGPGGVDVLPRLAPLPFEPEDLPLFRSTLE